MSKNAQYIPNSESGEAIAVELDIRLLCAMRAPLVPGVWDIGDQRLGHWRFYLNDGPGGMLDFDGKTIRLEPDRIYLIPADMGFGTRCDAVCMQFWIHFDWVGLPALALREMIDIPVLVPVAPGLCESASALGIWIGGGANGGLEAHCLVKALLYQTLGLCLGAMPADKSEWYRERIASLQHVLPALKRIDETPQDAQSNTDLASLCSMSTDHFIRCFKESVGRTPRQYVIDRRIAIAIQRLLFTDHTIERIAEEMGFGNRNYFSRVFAQHTGRYPATYRRTIGEPNKASTTRP